VDKGSLLYFDDELALYNPRLRCRYLISDNVPVMLAGQAETVSDAEHTRLVERARAGSGITTLD
jgi:uncharacterized protein